MKKLKTSLTAIALLCALHNANAQKTTDATKAETAIKPGSSTFSLGMGFMGAGKDFGAGLGLLIWHISIRPVNVLA